MARINNKHAQDRARELLKFSLVSTGTYLSSHLLMRLAKKPILLFGLGLATGFYLHKNRKQIFTTLVTAKEQGLALLDPPSENSAE